jgi:hypothetical protein
VMCEAGRVKSNSNEDPRKLRNARNVDCLLRKAVDTLQSWPMREATRAGGNQRVGRSGVVQVLGSSHFTTVCLKC